VPFHSTGDARIGLRFGLLQKLPAETTRAIHMYVPMSAPPFGIYGNNTQNAAVADKHQIELAVSLRTESTRTSALRENEKPTLLTRRQIILDGAYRSGATHSTAPPKSISTPEENS
jgi:hypothetical protein